jgi:ubiquinone biosynthesis protein Coq4
MIATAPYLRIFCAPAPLVISNWKVYLPWAARTGLRCADLVSIYYEKHFEEDLDELRRR